MGRAPKVQPEDPFKFLTPERVNQASQLLLIVGTGAVTWAVNRMVMLYVVPAGMEWFKERLNPKNMIMGSIPMIGSVYSSYQFIEKIIDKISKVDPQIQAAATKKAAAEQYLNTLKWTIDRQSEKEREANRDQNQKNIDAAEKRLEDATVEYDNLKAFRDELVMLQNTIGIGAGMIAAGIAGWLSCHPDVVKEGIKTTGDIAEKLIDEADQVVKQAYPSLLKLIGV